MSVQTPARPDEVTGTDQMDTADVSRPATDTGAEEWSATTDASIDDVAPVSTALTCACALLATAAGGWLCAGLFRGDLARAVGLAGALLGVGIVFLSYRTRRPSVVQYLGFPVICAIGALLVLQATNAAGSGLFALIGEALRAGGISQPPVAFEPGWRFLLLVIVATVGMASAGVGIGSNRPKLAILVAVPVIFGAALLQPDSAPATSTAVALVLGIGSVGVAFGVDLRREGATSGKFELRRMGRAAAVLACLVGALLAVSQLGFLFPSSSDERVIPPQRPEFPPPAPDRELFTARLAKVVPLRLGVLDVYGEEEGAWLTPPFRNSRLARIPESGVVPVRGNDPAGSGSTLLEPPAAPADRLIRAEFTIADVPGSVIPTIANPRRVVHPDFDVSYDPRTQTLRLPDGRARRGASYLVEGPGLPTGQELAEAPPIGESECDAAPVPACEFLNAPDAPLEVQQLVERAYEEATTSFGRLQFVRTEYYKNVIAAGAGTPKDVPPSRVVAMLAGEEATPYEITAGEVLLARWAGVPSRMGFGYFGGDRRGDTDMYSFRPKHGATWLEVYFEGHGWVPIVGTPPKAKASQSQNDKRNDPTVQVSDELAVVVYVPIRLESIQLLYAVVRFWLVRALPWALLSALVLASYPGFVKVARRARRRRWARAHGLPERLGVAYAEFRDAAYDLNLGDPVHTPLEFFGDFHSDPEHRELAWVVSRAIWGDLARDLRQEDVEAAEDLASSLIKRLLRANAGLPRMIAFCSRASLRSPYTDEVPNLWPQPHVRRRIRSGGRALRGRLAALPRLRPSHVSPRAAAVVIAVMAAMTSGCVQTTDLVTKGPDRFPEVIAPSTMDGYTFVPEPAGDRAFDDPEIQADALVSDGRVFTVHEAEVIHASLQVATFKPGLDSRIEHVREGVLRGIGGGKFTLKRVGAERVYVASLPEQRMLLSFAPDGSHYQLLVASKDFEDADRLFASLLAVQRGEIPVEIRPTESGPSDARRGLGN